MATYACSDLHGNWELWAEIKKFLKPDDTLYYLKVIKGCHYIEML